MHLEFACKCVCVRPLKEDRQSNFRTKSTHKRITRSQAIWNFHWLIYKTTLNISICSHFLTLSIIANFSMNMLWVSLVLGAICLGSASSSVIHPLQRLQQEVDQMKIQIRKLESESVQRSKITEPGRQWFIFVKYIFFLLSCSKIFIT